MQSRRIGVFGGTFDPVHIGHLVAAVNARHAAQLDVVLMVVANDPWQKSSVGRSVTPAGVRLAAVAAAVQSHDGLEVSHLEVDRGGPSYTVDTVRSILEDEPDAQIFVILGADAAAGLDSWHGASSLCELAEIIVVNRPNVPAPELSPRWRVTSVEIPALEVSSTDLRQRLVDGRPLDFLIPDAAVAVLKQGQ